MIRYTDELQGIVVQDLEGFFVGWPEPPTPEKHLELLQRSDHLMLAIDEEKGRVVGFITALSDGVLSAFIPFLEVLPEYQRGGIGSELLRHMLAKLEHVHKVDMLCDEGVQPLYTRLGMRPFMGMSNRPRRRRSPAQ